MARIDKSTHPDSQVRQILDLFIAYECTHPNARIEGRRHSEVSIRLRIIDPDFQGKIRVEPQHFGRCGLGLLLPAQLTIQSGEFKVSVSKNGCVGEES